jgi:hypothetical protein
MSIETRPSGIPNFERFFREAASLDVDKDDIKRVDEFVRHEIADLLTIGEAHAKANDRDIIEPWDLPVTKGLQETVHRFRRLDDDVELEPILERKAVWPQLEIEISEETRDRLPELAGGLTMALAQSFTLIDPNVKNPQTWQWERAFRLFDLLL